MKYESVEFIELFGKEYEIESNKNGYIKLKSSPIFIKQGIVYTPRGEVVLSLAQTDKIRKKMVKINEEEDTRSEEQKTNETIIDMFKEG